MKPERANALAAALLIAGAIAAYHATFAVPFLFDDLPSILDNPTIRRLWPLSGPLAPPGGFGLTVSGRPLLNLSLALNYALSGEQVWSYHALNLLIHVCAGLTLFGLARRTLLRPVLPEPLRAQARPAAFALALLWTLHPLQTESVTYIIQRAEALMGFFFLLTLYGFVRAAEAERPRAWLAFSWTACALGTGCKEVMATAPLVVLLYDRTFVAGGFRSAWRNRRGYYAALLATWLPVFWLNAGAGGDRGGTFNFTAAGFATYWLAQAEAVAVYLKLALWPSPLIFEYGWFKPDIWRAVVPAALLVGALAGATLWALRRRRVAGFFSAVFFVLLAPTSLMPGTVQIIVEHRMYLPLAAVLALVVGGATQRFGRRGVALCLVLAAGAGAMTLARNRVYQTDLGLWTDTVEKRPGSAKAQANLGKALYERARYAEAAEHFAASCRLDPAVATTAFNLGLALEKLGRADEAAAHYADAVRLAPRFAAARAQWGAALLRQNKFAEAWPQLAAAVGERPDWAEAEVNLASAGFGLGRNAEALAHVQRALQLQPDLAAAHYQRGLILAALGRADEAMAADAEAVRLDPEHGEARLNLGIALARRGRLPEALVQLGAAARLRPALPEAHANLGLALAEAGRAAEAVPHYETALRLRPDYALAHYNLGNAFVLLQRGPEAAREFAEAVRLQPEFPAAREMLERVTAALRARGP